MEDNLRKLQNAELCILKKVTKFLDENSIDYYIIYGTLLGAVRHKGFIPWDDDIDICVPREDYETLVKIADKFIGSIELTEYRLGNSKSQILQAIDKSVIVRTKPYPGSTVINSRYAWIDIFPVDGLPQNKLLREIHARNILFHRFLWGLSVNDMPTKTDLVKSSAFRIKQLIYYIGIPKLLNRDKRLKKLNEHLMRYPYKTSKYVFSSASSYNMKEIMPKKFVAERTWLSFEGELFKAPKNYDLLLKHIYGDYMIPPPEGSGSRDHHNLVEILENQEICNDSINS